MSIRTDIVYYYDGTFEGLMSCVYESFYENELPEAILAEDSAELLLYEKKYVSTELSRSKRVAEAIKKKISAAAYKLVEDSFHTCLVNKERHILLFIRFGFKAGRKATDMMGERRVEVLQSAVRHLYGEACQYTGFLRFSDYGGVLGATIEPKNNTLPYLAEHFCRRFAGEAFIIYDKTNRLALLYKDGKRMFTRMDGLRLPETNGDEELYRALWRSFYTRVAIRERTNKRLRMTHMPKRYWANMTEMQQEQALSLKNRA